MEIAIRRDDGSTVDVFDDVDWRDFGNTGSLMEKAMIAWLTKTLKKEERDREVRREMDSIENYPSIG